MATYFFVFFGDFGFLGVLGTGALLLANKVIETSWPNFCKSVGSIFMKR